MPTDRDRNSLLPEYDIAGMGTWLGAQQGLRGIVADRAAQAALQRKQESDDLEATIKARKQALEEDQLTQKAFEFGEGRPGRESEVALRLSQSADLDRKPSEERAKAQREMEKAIAENDMETALEHAKHIWEMDKQRDSQTFTAGQNDKNREKDIRVAGMRAAASGGAGGQGASRALTSTRAQELADIETSSTLADELDTQVGDEGGTGFLPWITARLPNVVSEYTGVGEEAKGRLATIALVKQIIGKGLEGGVLREHDEVKYKDILPTISDPNAVVKSKIGNLKKLLAVKREQDLQAYEDASYDTSRYRARDAQTAADAPPVSEAGAAAVLDKYDDYGRPIKKR